MTNVELAAPVAGSAFEAAYNLPDAFPDDMVALHREILDSLRNEARALPMSTNLRMLTERMAYFYVAMKWREASSENPLSLKETKEMLDFWLKIMTEFNKLMVASADKARSSLIEELQTILKGAVKLVDNVDNRISVANYLSAELARIDV